MSHHLFRNYRIINVMFWAFPYLLWQAFGQWSGFIVGVIVAVILTVMLNDLVGVSCSHTLSYDGRCSFEATESRPQDQEVGPYPQKEVPPEEVL